MRGAVFPLVELEEVTLGERIGVEGIAHVMIGVGGIAHVKPLAGGSGDV